MTDKRDLSSARWAWIGGLGVFLIVLAGAFSESAATAMATNSSIIDVSTNKPVPTSPAATFHGISAQSASNGPPPSDRLVFSIAAGVSTLFVIGMGIFSYWRRKQADNDVIPEPELIEPPPDADEEVVAEKIPVLLDEVQGIRYILSQGTTRAGRHSDNDICVTDASVSRHHAEFNQRSDGRFLVIDLDSMNGVFLNDQQISSSKLKDGDLVELGDLALRFRLLDELSDAGDIEHTLKISGPPGDFGNANFG